MPTTTLALPVKIKSSYGYVRAWNFQHPIAHLTALGIYREDDKDKQKSINGIAYPVYGDESEMKVFDEREIGYDRILINHEYIINLSWFTIPDDSKLWIYVPSNKIISGPSVK